MTLKIKNNPQYIKVNAHFILKKMNGLEQLLKEYMDVSFGLTKTSKKCH
jgi:hypothetical protein